MTVSPLKPQGWDEPQEVDQNAKIKVQNYRAKIKSFAF
jgi:hypothetical protein